MRCNGFTVVSAIAAVTLLALAASANAGIIIDSQTTINGPGGAISTVDFGSYNSTGKDKLVVLVGGGRDRGSSLVISSVTFGGTPLAEAVKVSSTTISPQGAAAGIYYLDTPGVTTGNLVVNFAAKSWGIRNAITVLELSGTETGVGPVASSPDSPTVSLTPVAVGDLVLAVSKAVPDVDSELALAPLTSMVSGRIGSGYQFVTLPGTVNPAFSGWSVPGAGATVAAAFQAAPTAVPEPSTFLLSSLGFFGLAFAGRRRRKRQT